MRVTVVIPTYNERSNIEKIVPLIFSLLKEVSIVVVDDNSLDKTASAVLKLQKNYSNLHLIARRKKTGRGSAVLEGFKYAFQKIKTDIFIEMDADLSHDPNELPRLVKMSNPRTVILASRYLPESKILDWPIIRVLSSKIANFLIGAVLDLPVIDNTNGYRCYQKEAIKILLTYNFVSRGYILLSESEKILYDRGFELIEIPTIFRNRIRGESKDSISEFFYSLYLLFKIRLYSKLRSKQINNSRNLINS